LHSLNFAGFSPKVGKLPEKEGITLDSIWTRTARLPSFPPLSGDISTEAAVIGGGMTGILTACALRQAGVPAVVLEAGTIASGQTAGTTAKLTAQHGLRYAWLTEKLGRAAAGQYALANLRAAAWVRSLGADCDLRDCTSYLYTAGAPAPLREELEAGRRLGLELFLTEDTELPFPATALGLRHQAVFHPLKLIGALARELTIYEHTQVLGVDGATVLTGRGRVRAEWVIFACHFPFVNVPGWYFVRQRQERSYVLALEGPPPLRDAYLGLSGDGLSLRSWDRYLLLGGAGHPTGENQKGGQYARLRQAAARLWPGCREAAAWSAQDCVPYDGVPYIGRFSPARPQWLVATGFQKWGMTSAAVAAQLLTGIVTDQELPDGDVFAPHRFHPAAAGGLLQNVGKAAKGLSRRVIAPGRISVEQLPRGHGGVVKLDGKKLGAYRDRNGTLYTVSLRCPHLGCQLEWNPEERTWDCPCHGSRFTFRGERISGPAQRDAER